MFHGMSFEECAFFIVAAFVAGMFIGLILVFIYALIKWAVLKLKEYIRDAIDRH